MYLHMLLFLKSHFSPHDDAGIYEITIIPFMFRPVGFQTNKCQTWWKQMPNYRAENQAKIH